MGARPALVTDLSPRAIVSLHFDLRSEAPILKHCVFYKEKLFSFSIKVPMFGVGEFGLDEKAMFSRQARYQAALSVKYMSGKNSWRDLRTV